jgi:predicted MFS family arabinose efflux permease|tara:strand:+ start:11621 stop:12397 length:777 start_codon:yes stop_codon:yes gene_type:complete
MLVGTGVASILAPALLGQVIAEHGWRAAMLVMGGAILAIGLPVSLLMPREEVSAGAGDATSPRKKGKFEANRSSVFLTLIAFLLGLVVAGLIVLLVPMLIDGGMDDRGAANVAAQLGVAILVTRIIAGYLFDRFHAPYVAAILLLSPVVASLILLNGGPVIIAALLLGVAAGPEVDMLAYLTGRYVQMENYGASYGTILGLFCLGAAIGPMLFGWTVDMTGDYGLILTISTGVLLLVVFGIAVLGPYQSKEIGVAKTL